MACMPHLLTPLKREQQVGIPGTYAHSYCCCWSCASPGLLHGRAIGPHGTSSSAVMSSQHRGGQAGLKAHSLCADGDG